MDFGDPHEMRQKEPSLDLLSQYEAEVARKSKQRKVAYGVVGVTLLAAAVAEPLLYRSEYILGGTVGVILIAIVLGIMLAYSGGIFYLSWSYADAVQRKGQVRVHPLHILAILALSGFSALFLASGTIREKVTPVFWIALLFVVWTNMLPAILGYVANFWSKGTRKP